MSQRDAANLKRNKSISESEKRSYVKEQIVIKPSTEFVPDEYEHTDNKQAEIHVFVAENSALKKENNAFLKTMKSLKYEIPESHQHGLKNKMAVFETLDKIIQSTNGKSMLMILFLGFFDSPDDGILRLSHSAEINLVDIWSRFTSRRCRLLANKPKVFIFEGLSFHHDFVLDSAGEDHKKVFEMPVEADLLIIHKKIGNSNEQGFLKTLCQNVEKYGGREDIISLLTYAGKDYVPQPIIISTLTRKLYITSSSVRGHHFTIRKLHYDVQSQLRYAQEAICHLKEEIDNQQKSVMSRREERIKRNPSKTTSDHFSPRSSRRNESNETRKINTAPSESGNQNGGERTGRVNSILMKKSSVNRGQTMKSPSQQKPRWQF